MNVTFFDNLVRMAGAIVLLLSCLLVLKHVLRSISRRRNHGCIHCGYPTERIQGECVECGRQPQCRHWTVSLRLWAARFAVVFIGIVGGWCSVSPYSFVKLALPRQIELLLLPPTLPESHLADSLLRSLWARPHYSVSNAQLLVGWAARQIAAQSNLAQTGYQVLSHISTIEHGAVLRSNPVLESRPEELFLGQPTLSTNSFLLELDQRHCSRIAEVVLKQMRSGDILSLDNGPLVLSHLREMPNRYVVQIIKDLADQHYPSSCFMGSSSPLWAEAITSAIQGMSPKDRQAAITLFQYSADYSDIRNVSFLIECASSGDRYLASMAWSELHGFRIDPHDLLRATQIHRARDPEPRTLFVELERMAQERLAGQMFSPKEPGPP